MELVIKDRHVYRKPEPKVEPEPPKKERVLEPTPNHSETISAMQQHINDLNAALALSNAVRQVNIVATVQRDKSGKMSSIMIKNA